MLRLLKENLILRKTFVLCRCRCTRIEETYLVDT